MSSKRSEKVPTVASLHALSAADGPAILLDRNYRILAANEAYRTEMDGEKDIEGSHCYEISHGFDRPCDQAGESCPLQSSIATLHRERVLHIHLSSHGREFVDVEIQPILDEDGELRHFLEVLRPTMIANAEPSPSGLVGTSRRFNEMMELVQRVAVEDTSVLLLGESGTGKELIARAIHEGSNRAKMPFVPVECSGLTESLFESELFGHRKGAFTGAQFEKPGLVESAHGGTLFLDEIGEMTPQLQVKLLRLIETQTFRRVGDIDARYVDFRLVCATNRDLKEMVEEGTFRSDLYYRLSTYPIDLPALRERREDIGLLADSLLKRSRDSRALVLSDEVRQCLANYAFPGNIRELGNVLERARILATGTTLLPEHFPGICKPAASQEAVVDGPIDAPSAGSPDNFTVAGVQPLDEVERQYLSHVLSKFEGQRGALAEKLGVSPRTLTRKLQNLRQMS